MLVAKQTKRNTKLDYNGLLKHDFRHKTMNSKYSLIQLCLTLMEMKN